MKTSPRLGTLFLTIIILQNVFWMNAAEGYSISVQGPSNSCPAGRPPADDECGLWPRPSRGRRQILPPGADGVPGRNGVDGGFMKPGQPGQPGQPGAPGAPGPVGMPGYPGGSGGSGGKGGKGGPGWHGYSGSPGTPGTFGRKGSLGDRGFPGVSVAGGTGGEGGTGGRGGNIGY